MNLIIKNLNIIQEFQIKIDEDILNKLKTPFSWAVYEILAITLLILVIYDIINRYKDKNTQFTRLLEIIGFIIYALFFENIGVLSSTYNYSQHRFMIFGVVPLSIPVFEAVIFYYAMIFAEKAKFKKWTQPFLTAFLGMLQDFTLDPVAIADVHTFNEINGQIQQGRWIWDLTKHYQNAFFGIPYFNFTGWFALMFYYSTFIVIGRNYFEKKEKELKTGIRYVIIATILSDILICSPISFFLLYAYPITPTPFGNRTAEIIMLTIVSIITISVITYQYIEQNILTTNTNKNTNKNTNINIKDQWIVFTIPISIHMLDLIVAISEKLYNAIIPVIIFSSIHITYISLYFKNKKKHNVSK